MTYSGNKLFNSNNAIGAVMVILGVVLSATQTNSDFGFLFIVIPIAFLITAAEAFYFEITIDELIIKNCMIPFLNIRYKLNEITQVQLLESGYRSTAKARVKIIRGDKQSIGYKAASLGIKDWQGFVNELIDREISVYIEASNLKSKLGFPED